MKFSTILVSEALFAAAALAAPRSSLAQRQARRAAGFQHGQPMIPYDTDGPETETSSNNTEVSYSQNWSGAVITSPPSGETFNAVYGTFTVPTPSAGSTSARSYSASAWVGIDGDTYGNAILQSGVDFTVTSAGDVSYDSWYEWYPDYAYDFDSFTVSAGDVITISIVASSLSAGTVTLDNTSTGQSVSKSLTAPSSSSDLGGQNAEWIVEDYESGSSLVSLADWGTVTFTDCSATTSSTSEGLDSASVIDIKQSGTVYTSVTIVSNTELEVQYTG